MPDLIALPNKYLLSDFYERLISAPRAEKIRELWDTELRFSEIANIGTAEEGQASQIYVDVMPAFISASLGIGRVVLVRLDIRFDKLWCH